MFFFFFKQKTAYEMRISDWSSDVCSSDLKGLHHLGQRDRDDQRQRRRRRIAGGELHDGRSHEIALPVAPRTTAPPAPRGLAVGDQIGRASCRERVCQYVSISVVAVSFKHITNNKTYTPTHIRYEQKT